MFVMMTMMATSRFDGYITDGNLCRSTSASPKCSSSVLPLCRSPLTIDRFANGLTRPLFGWVSDRIGRENTTFIAFALEGASDDALAALRATTRFCLCCLSGLVFFGWGEIFSLFPSTLTDTFGTRHATTNLRLALHLLRDWLDLRRSSGCPTGSLRPKPDFSFRLRDRARFLYCAPRCSRLEAGACKLSRAAQPLGRQSRAVSSARFASPHRPRCANRRASRCPRPAPPCLGSRWRCSAPTPRHSTCFGRSPSSSARSSRWRSATSSANSWAEAEFLSNGLRCVTAGERALHEQAAGRALRIGELIGRAAQQLLHDRARRRRIQGFARKSSSWMPT